MVTAPAAVFAGPAVPAVVTGVAACAMPAVVRSPKWLRVGGLATECPGDEFGDDFIGAGGQTEGSKRPFPEVGVVDVALDEVIAVSSPGEVQVSTDTSAAA